MCGCPDLQSWYACSIRSGHCRVVCWLAAARCISFQVPCQVSRPGRTMQAVLRGRACPLPTAGPDSGRVAQHHKVQQCCHGQLSGGRDGSRSTPAHGMQQCVPVLSSALHATSWDSEAVCWQAGASSSTGSGLCTQLCLLLGCNECANPVPRRVLLVSLCSGKYLLVIQHRVWSSSC